MKITPDPKIPHGLCVCGHLPAGYLPVCKKSGVCPKAREAQGESSQRGFSREHFGGGEDEGLRAEAVEAVPFEGELWVTVDGGIGGAAQFDVPQHSPNGRIAAIAIGASFVFESAGGSGSAAAGEGERAGILFAKRLPVVVRSRGGLVHLETVSGMLLRIAVCMCFLVRHAIPLPETGANGTDRIPVIVAQEVPFPVSRRL